VIKEQEIIQILKNNGIKTTPQRMAIISFLDHNRIHPSAENIYKTLKKDFPSMSLATVYNTLEKLKDIKKVVKLNISGDNKVYYDYNTEDHYHFYCNTCNKIYDLEHKNQGTKPGDHVNGHKVEETHTYFKGICKSCVEQKKLGGNK